MTEKYRPQIHMTPDSGWMNDPNGLVFFNGEYHQFYQYYPNDTVWGPMHWGHKVSRDLVHWRELEPALYPDESGMCFSGSAIVDWNNTSGLFESGQPGLLAFYTSFLQPNQKLMDGSTFENPIQQQSLAYSANGIDWHKYRDGAPIIPARGNPDFRDPKVFWHEASKAYVMVVSCGQHIEFFRSTNLLDWQLISEFGYRHGAHSKGPWECPDLFELSLSGTEKSYWVLVVGIGEGAHCGGAGTQYFIGDFDGETFTNLNHPEKVLWLDFGRDYYATQSFSDIPAEDGRRIVSTWMSNHQYSLELPTESFRSSMTMPRELFLFESAEGLRVGQRFTKELASALSTDASDLTPENEQAISLYSQYSVMHLGCDIELDEEQVLHLGLYQDNAAFFEFQPVEGGLEVRTVRRGEFGTERIDEHFPHDYRVVLPTHSSFSLEVLFDKGSIELLINNGEYSFTNLLYPNNTQASAVMSVDSGTLRARNLITKSRAGEA
ncbi:glycoside hydrolase family 32 protein [Vibrio agarivorans]|uniref:Glycoside hydrolase family 32 protein n=1 Tax=Vibrio agarivorans TaxID=153622 RepID=A0ABT7Y5P6_9VIBR|nr:glycoside hydrolase family 32 protein [Vibrio agarivorans]MDN2483369.1 glycoside hydrolase family 32 protein [Vibrio agarivorans]